MSFWGLFLGKQQLFKLAFCFKQWNKTCLLSRSVINMKPKRHKQMRSSDQDVCHLVAVVEVMQKWRGYTNRQLASLQRSHCRYEGKQKKAPKGTYYLLVGALKWVALLSGSPKLFNPKTPTGTHRQNSWERGEGRHSPTLWGTQDINIDPDPLLLQLNGIQATHRLPWTMCSAADYQIKWPLSIQQI